MKILKMINMHLPHSGSPFRSTTRFAEAFLELGHGVLVVMPKPDGKIPDEDKYISIPLILRRTSSSWSGNWAGMGRNQGSQDFLRFILPGAAREGVSLSC